MVLCANNRAWTVLIFVHRH